MAKTVDHFYIWAYNVRNVRKVRILEDLMKIQKEDRFIVSVKVGPKGQITIPVQARKMFDINEGDTLMFMGDKTRGIALLKDDIFYSMMGDVIPNDSNQDK